MRTCHLHEQRITLLDATLRDAYVKHPTSTVPSLLERSGIRSGARQERNDVTRIADDGARRRRHTRCVPVAYEESRPDTRRRPGLNIGLLIPDK